MVLALVVVVGFGWCNGPCDLAFTYTWTSSSHAYWVTDQSTASSFYLSNGLQEYMRGREMYQQKKNDKDLSGSCGGSIVVLPECRHACTGSGLSSSNWYRGVNWCPILLANKNQPHHQQTISFTAHHLLRNNIHIASFWSISCNELLSARLTFIINGIKSHKSFYSSQPLRIRSWRAAGCMRCCRPN